MGFTIPSTSQSSTQSIKAQQRIIQNISANLAGASDPTRSATAVKLESDQYGVRANPAQRIEDTLRTEDVRLKVIGVSYLETLQGVHDEVMRELGTPGDESSLGSRLTLLKTRLGTLEDAPSIPGLGRDVVGSLKTTVSSINDLGKFFQSERLSAENGIQDSVQNVNGILQALGTLNQEIAIATGRGDTTASLDDTQDALLKELSQYIDIKIQRRDDKTIEVTTNIGQALVIRSGAKALDFTRSTSIGPADTAGTLSAITVDGKNITNSISNGKIGAFLKARDVVLPGMQAELDEFTEKFSTQFNGIHNQGTPFPPQTSVTGTTTFLTPAVTTMQMDGVFRIALLDKATGNHAIVPLDIDLTGPAQTIDDVVTQIDAALGVNGSATLNAVRQLVITATDPNHGVAFVSMKVGSEAVESTTGKGFSHFFGMNDLFTSGSTKIGGAQALALRSDIEANPGLLSKGTLSTTTGIGESGLQIGDASTITKMIAAFDQSLTFNDAGPMAGRDESLIQYANSIWHNAAIDAKNNASDYQIDKAILDDSERDLKARTGVNMHEQITKLLEAQQVLAASMKCLQANKEAFDQLIRSI